MFLIEISTLTKKLETDQTSAAANDLLAGMQEINKKYPNAFPLTTIEQVKGLITKLEQFEKTGDWSVVHQH
jgi:hypothetical protein